MSLATLSSDKINQMTTVKFLQDKSKLESVSRNIFSTYYPKNQDILVKIHFGEPGNKTAFFPKDIEPIINALKSLGLRPTFIDTPVAYDSPRNTVAGYEQVVRDRGYDKLAPFIISDNFIEIKTKDFTAKVCKELTEAQNLLVISHVKGHECAGFGGAIKNFGMGGMLPESKKNIHGLCQPLFTESSCTGCGTCARLCPAHAIEIINGKARVDLEKCYGCSICQINCPTHSLNPKLAIFDDLLAQGAAACINNLPKNSYYLNFIQNITKSCDCESNSCEILAPDRGVLFSDNPIAIDQASIDIIGKEIFENSNHKDPTLQIKYAQGYTKFTADYQLENL